MNRAYYSESIAAFVASTPNEILGEMARRNQFDLVGTQRNAWIKQTEILQRSLAGQDGSIYLEFSISENGPTH
jgi:hypothetical protein